MGKIDLAAMFEPQHLVTGDSENPILFISQSILMNTAQSFLRHFPGETSYAVKANSNALVLKELVKNGISTFDVASIAEMKMVKDANPTAKLHYHNPVHSKDEIKLAYHNYGVRRFAVDHMDELFKIKALVPNPSEVEIAVRFCTESTSKAVMAFKSKFGASKLEASRILNEADRLGFVSGLTFHPGSQTSSPSPYIEHIEEAAEITRLANVFPEFLNVGGGFPARYTGIEIFPLEDYFKEIEEVTLRAFRYYPPKLECEPGRSMIAGAGTLQTQIKTVRKNQNEAFLNDGIYGGLMEVYQFPELRPEYEIEYINPATAHYTEWTVFGPTCDPIDMLPFKLSMPETIEEGDIVRFLGVGAYCNATATSFNGYGNIDLMLIA